LLDDLMVKAKEKAAKKYCKKNGLLYFVWTEKELKIK
jgi:hypothetical protein